MSGNSGFLSMEQLQAAVPHILAAPKDNAAIEMLCLRPEFGQRKFVNEITMSRAGGIPGERWADLAWLRLKDGTPDPRIQVCILGRRVLDLVWRDHENTLHPGDTFIADMDFSEANLPSGSLLGAGSVVLRVSTKFNDACVKWKTRYGKDAKDWIVLPENIPHRLRGVLCEVVQDGTITTGDRLRKLPPLSSVDSATGER